MGRSRKEEEKGDPRGELRGAKEDDEGDPREGKRVGKEALNPKPQNLHPKHQIPTPKL